MSVPYINPRDLAEATGDKGAVLTPSQQAVLKRHRAKLAVAKRFAREAEGHDLAGRMKLSIEYQRHLDEIEAEYRRDIGISLHRAICTGGK